MSRSQVFNVYKLKEQAFEEFYPQEHQELANEILQSIKKKNQHMRKHMRSLILFMQSWNLSLILFMFYQM